MMSSSGLFRRLNADSLRTLFVGIVAGIVISSVSVLMLMVTDPKRTRIAEEYSHGAQQGAGWYGSVEWAQTVLERNVVAQNKSRVQKRPPPRSRPRILCWVMTQPKNHQAKDVHIKATWGRRCDKLLFMSTEADASLPAVKLDCGGDRNSLWCKTQQAFKYVYENHFDEADWFLKADDDTYVVVDNLRSFVAAKDPADPVYFGFNFKVHVRRQGYMSGGAGYVLSREAVRRFVLKGLGGRDSNVCKWQSGTGAEDVEMGRCLMNLGVAAGDSRDELARSRFFPFPPGSFLIPGTWDPNYWFFKYKSYELEKGPGCCSDSVISFHYVPPQQMYVYDYFINKVGFRLGQTSERET